tara:strand:+ start:138 stop:491 length:354 start_codon:yes stop_codon:yes gene_type:complete
MDPDFNRKAYASSPHESGLQDIAQVTWENAKDEWELDNRIINKTHVEELRDHFAEYGAWEREEIEAWDLSELNALVIQEIAGDIFEHGEPSKDEPKDDEWRKIFYGTDNQFYIYLGN